MQVIIWMLAKRSVRGMIIGALFMAAWLTLRAIQPSEAQLTLLLMLYVMFAMLFTALHGISALNQLLLHTQRFIAARTAPRTAPREEYHETDANAPVS